MTFEVLLSCMHLNTDEEILKLATRTNIHCRAVIVSQCDRNAISQIGDIKIIYTTERGLSRSRNMAIHNSTADICLICDDDEVLADNLEGKIVKAYLENPEVSLIAFALDRKDVKKAYPKAKKSLGFRQILKTSSHQISFKKADLMRKYIRFDEQMGSGTGNGGGEENKFLLDFRRAGCKMLYNPEVIATVNPGESQWFHGYDAKCIQNLGWSSRRAMGTTIGFLYIHYWIASHHKLYSPEMSIRRAYQNIIKGFYRN